MIDFAILNSMGTTNARLREIFEKKVIPQPEGEPPSPPPDDASAETKASYMQWCRYWQNVKDIKVAALFTTEIQGRLNESIQWGLRNYKLYAAVDLAWDTPTISKETLPLQLYAQGKIDLEACQTELSALPIGKQYVRRNEQGKATAIDLPKFIDVSVNLVRSMLTRRHAAQANKYNNLYPYYKYESRSTGLVGKLRADVMSQQAEIIVDGFDYRHHDEQVMRDALLYGRCIDFVRCGWERHEQFRQKALAPELTGSNGPIQTEIFCVKQGVSFHNPHPTRLILDNSEPISSINTDTGPNYIGYWDVTRYGEINNNPLYFNRDAIGYGPNFWSILTTYSAFFTQYYTNVKAPPSDPQQQRINADTAGNNDAKNTQSLYATNMDDMAVIKAEYFRRLIPKDHGMGNYPFPVWVRFVIAGDSTVIFAEFLPSTPAAVCSMNEKDDRRLSVSFGMDLLWAQDMMSNLVTSMLLAVQRELLTVIGINTDLVSEADQKTLKDRLAGRDWSVDPIVIPFSLKQIADEMGLKPNALFQIGETAKSGSIQQCFQAMTQLMSLVERMSAMSPAEQGQPAPREISATEVSEMASTTQSVYSFISDDVDEYRAAKKRIVYESCCGCSEGTFQVPVINRYSEKTIKKAGFKVAPDDDDYAVGQIAARTVLGTRKNLVHDYIFTTRDGSERPVNTQAANTLVQLLQVALQVPAVMQAITKDKLFDMFNEVFRMSGAGVDLLLEMQEGDDNSMGADQIQQMQEVLKQLGDALNQVVEQTKKNAEDIATQEQINQKQEALLQGASALADAVKKAVVEIQAIGNRVNRLEKAPLPEIKYQDAPPDVQRQMEERSGYQPSRLPPGDGAAAAAAKTHVELEGAAARTAQELRHNEQAHQQDMQHRAEAAAMKASTTPTPV